MTENQKKAAEAVGTIFAWVTVGMSMGFVIGLLLWLLQTVWGAL